MPIPPSLLFAIIFALVAAIVFIAKRRLAAKAKRTESKEDRDNAAVAKGSFWLFAVFSLLLVFNASANIVPTKNVGIVTQFKAQTGDLTGAGLQFVLPWQKVDAWDASNQTFDHLHESTAVQVRIVGLQQAWVEVKIEWKVDPAKAPEQWAAYKEHDFEVFKDRRIDPNLTGAVNDAYESHNPLSNVDQVTGAINPPPKQPFIDAIKRHIASRLNGEIIVHSVVIGFIKYDDKTQEQISAYQQKVLEGRNLDVDLANAKKRQQINDEYKKRDPVTWCLDIAEAKGKEPGLCLGGVTPVLPVK